MTPTEFLRVLVRRWYVLVATLVVTAGVALLLPGTPGVWYTRVDVVFVSPNSPKLVGNALEGDNQSVVDFAAAIERQVNGSAQSIQLSSTEASLYGAGVRRGYLVTLPNEGGQWTPSFDQAVLRLEVVDGSEQQTRDVADRIIAQVETAAAYTQDLLDIPTQQRIRTEVNPSQPVVGYVAGSRKRALAVLGLLGGGVAVAGAVAVDRTADRRRSSRPEAAGAPTAVTA